MIAIGLIALCRFLGNMARSNLQDMRDALMTNSTLVESYQGTHGSMARPLRQRLEEVFGSDVWAWWLPIPARGICLRFEGGHRAKLAGRGAADRGREWLLRGVGIAQSGCGDIEYCIGWQRWFGAMGVTRRYVVGHDDYEELRATVWID